MKFQGKSITLLVLMLLSVWSANALRPNRDSAKQPEALNLSAMVPSAFGDWKELRNLSALIVNPQQKNMLEKLYNETLTRTYVDSQGYQIMLSIAHGKDQKDGIELHKPDVCYPAQGFEITARQTQLLLFYGQNTGIQVTRLLTKNRSRKEPLIYWTLIGSTVFNSRTQKKYTEIKYTLNNEIPDGMLVRVSSIDDDNARALTKQTEFINAWHKISDEKSSLKFFGRAEV